VQDNGTDYRTYLGTLSWARNTLNRGVFADRGASQTISLDFSIPGSDITYYKLNYTGQLYVPVAGRWVGRLRTNLGYGDGYGSTTILPFYKNYFAGGFGSVRGYRDNRMGPRSPSYLFTSVLDGGKCTVAPCVDTNPEVVGGNILMEGSAELIFPTPFAADNRQLRTMLFLDAGNVYHTDLPDTGPIRYTTGVSLSWLTAIGPLSFSLSRALNKQPGDEVQTFQFSIGRGL
jgi:outer membrane protein insertion porin family